MKWGAWNKVTREYLQVGTFDFDQLFFHNAKDVYNDSMSNEVKFSGEKELILASSKF